MKHALTKIIIILFSVSLVGCGNMSKQDAGVITGGVAGGLLGSQFGHGNGQLLAIGMGTLAGAYIGGSIGRSMDDLDRMKMTQALERNNVGQPAYWRNKRTGTDYTVVPTRDVSVSGNPYCREYRTTAFIAGKKQQIYGTACRQPDGSWKVAN